MTDIKQTKAEKYIEQLMQELTPDSDRYRVLATAKQFKASWAELGERLVNVSQRSLFRDWGYDSFGEYCSREIRIRKATAEKLTMAYKFLEREEPGVLARNEGLQPLPDYRSVDLLRRAQEEGQFEPEQYQALREAVVEDDRSLPVVRKQFQEVTRAKEEQIATSLRQSRVSLSTARRLQTALEPMGELYVKHKPFLDSLIADLAVAEEQAALAVGDEKNEDRAEGETAP
jgi:hypothetical protein